MGPVDTSLRDAAKGRPTGVMMVGLQGSGKTTTAGKLASRLLKEGKKPLLVAADIYRPAAVEQLRMLGEQLGVPVFHEAGHLAAGAVPQGPRGGAAREGRRRSSTTPPAASPSTRR